MSLTTCLGKAGNLLPASDKSAILERAREYRQEGMSTTAAAARAVTEQLRQVQVDLDKAIKQDRESREVKQSPGRDLQTETAAFKKWFGDSKVVDADGKPLVVYHGTEADFTVFRASTEGQYGPGIYFSSSERAAKSWSYRGKPENARVVSSYLSLQNPYRAAPGDSIPAREKLLDSGHDGIIIESSNGYKDYVAFNSVQVKDAVNNNGDFDPASNNITQSPARPEFYSQLERAIEGVPDRLATMAAPQWKLWLDANAGKLGVKKDEIEWSGIKNYLDLRGKDKVTREEVGAFLKDGGVKVKDVVLGNGTVKSFEKWIADKGYAPETIEAYGPSLRRSYDAFSQSEGEKENGTKYANYTVPGGTNYKEMLITLPEKAPAKGEIPAGYTLIDTAVEDRADGLAIPADATGPWRFKGPSVSSKVYKTREEALAALLKDAQSELKNGLGEHGRYRSSHFDQPNILAHVRMDDRTDAEGKKVLFLQELQSDYAQDGRKKGFKPTKSELSNLEPGSPEAIAALARGDFGPMTVSVDNGFGQPMRQTLTAQRTAKDERLPAAPFVRDTQAWVSLALKRAIMHAVESGHDKVAFITGEQAAGLYDLSKQISKVSWDKDTGRLTAYDKNTSERRSDGRTVIDESGVDETKLENYIGKEAAKRLMESEPDEDGTRELSGLDLKVGGEGMKTFYDTLVPQVANDVLKKLGGGKMGEVHFSTRYSSQEQDRAVERTGSPLEEGMATTNPGFTITDAMREKVSAGVPLFSPARDTSDGMNKTIASSDKSILPKVILADEMPPERDGFYRLFHAGSDPTRGGYFTAVPKGGVFDGMFALNGGAGNYGTGATYVADIADDKVLSSYNLEHKLDYEKTRSAFNKIMGKLSKADFDSAWEAVIEDQAHRVDDDDLMRIFGEDSVGEASWAAQKARGQVAKALGYEAVEMSDENGTAHLIVSGVPLTRIINDASDKPEYGEAKSSPARGTSDGVMNQKPGADKFNAQSAFESHGGNGDIDESTDITAKSQAFADMAEGVGYTVAGRGDKYVVVTKSFGQDADGYHTGVTIKARVSDHSNVNRGIHFGDTDINLAPDDGYDRDTFDSALRKLQSAYMNEDGDTVIPEEGVPLFSPARDVADGNKDTKSVLKDEAGKPLTLYHGGLVWDKFESGKSGRDALWLTPDVSTASGYADQYSPQEGREIKAFHVTMAKPLDLRKASVVEQVFGEDNAPEPHEMARDRALIEQALKYAKDKGYDGLIHPDSDNFNRYSTGRVSYAVLNTDQLQLAPLTGTDQDGNTYGIPMRGAKMSPARDTKDSTSTSQDQTDTPAFKKWFGGSKVVDAKGRPLVVYHGTSASEPIEKFAGNAYAGWFTPDTKKANAYTSASMDDTGEDAAIYPVYLSIKNPLDLSTIDASDKFNARTLADVMGAPEQEVQDMFDERAEGDAYWQLIDTPDFREWVQGLGRDGLKIKEDGAVTWAAINPTQIKSAIGNNGNFDPASNNITESKIREQNLLDGYKVSDFLDSSKQVSWWDKTVGTPYHLAQKNPEFKRVYDAVQNFIGDVSRYATRAADMAPTMLPKLENAKDIFKSPLSAEDVKTLSAPIFEGTLSYARDKNGEVFKTDDVGLAGVVWRDEEMKSMFGMNDRQIGLYREFRKSVNMSIRDLAITDMIHYAGADGKAVRESMLNTNSVKLAADILENHLGEMAGKDPDRAYTLLETARVVKAKADAAQGLIAKGYAPLSRYGDHTVYVTRGEGENQEQLFFGMYETAREANKASRMLTTEFPDANVKVGIMSKEAHTQFQGITPETMALLGDALGLEEDSNSPRSQMFQEMLKLSKSTRSAMKRMIERKGVEGYSEDAGRVLAGFVYSNSRQASQNLHAGEIAKSASEIPKEKGDLKDHALRLVGHINNPQDEANALRGMMFTSYIGGSLSSAATNLTQSLTTTLPALSQHFGIGKSGTAMASALHIINKGAGTDADLVKAMKRAEEEGITAPQETHALMAQAQGRGSLRSGDGTKTGDNLAKMSNGLAKVQLIWGKAFGWAEIINRKIAFVAAYKLAREKGITDPFEFAKDMVTKTQYVMNRGNSPNWARGPVGATLFTFKKFTVNYLEGLERMWHAGEPGSKERAEGRKAFALSLAIMFMLAGAGGFPFADDLDAILDGFMQRVLNKSFSSKQAKKAWVASIIGDAGANFVEGGISSLPGFPIDVSGRLGMGHVVPGIGFLQKKQDHARDIQDLMGVAGDFGSRMITGAGSLAQGDLRAAAESVVPIAIANALKAKSMSDLGYYTDKKGKKIIDTTMTEAILKGIGFQPASVKTVQEATGIQQDLIAQNKIREGEIAALWTRGRVERKPEVIEDARRQLADWNQENPGSKISISASQINNQVKLANMSKAQRLAKAAPKEIRAAVKAELARDLNH